MRAMRRLIALVLAATLAATLAAMPAAASSTSEHGASAAFCDPAVSGAPAQVQGRGGKIHEPELAQVHGDLPASAKGKAKANFSATVPVYFHVITDGGVGNLTARQLDDQVAVLNKTSAVERAGSGRTSRSTSLASRARTTRPGSGATTRAR